VTPRERAIKLWDNMPEKAPKEEFVGRVSRAIKAAVRAAVEEANERIEDLEDQIRWQE
jgi:hypothetical protein